jgi:hypothetical protein
MILSKIKNRELRFTYCVLSRYVASTVAALDEFITIQGSMTIILPIPIHSAAISSASFHSSILNAFVCTKNFPRGNMPRSNILMNSTMSSLSYISFPFIVMLRAIVFQCMTFSTVQLLVTNESRRGEGCNYLPKPMRLTLAPLRRHGTMCWKCID